MIRYILTPWSNFQLSTEVRTLLEGYKEQPVEAYTFEMYTTFQQLIELSQHIDKELVPHMQCITILY